jgi:hypothetical protein
MRLSGWIQSLVEWRRRADQRQADISARSASGLGSRRVCDRPEHAYASQHTVCRQLPVTAPPALASVV